MTEGIHIPFTVVRGYICRFSILTMMIERAQGYRPKRLGVHRGAAISHRGSEGDGIPFIHRGDKGHLKDDCYMVIGYPSDFISRRKASQQNKQA